MNACDAWKGLLAGHLYGDLEAAEAARVQAHVSGCAPCRAALAAMREASEGLDAWVLPGRATRRRRVAPPARRWPAVAAAAAAAVLLGILYASMRPPASPPAAPPVALRPPAQADTKRTEPFVPAMPVPAPVPPPPPPPPGTMRTEPFVPPPPDTKSPEPFVPPPPPPAPPEPPRPAETVVGVARLERARGEVRAGGRAKAKEGLELRAGEAVETLGAEASAALRFADGTLLQLDGDTRLGRVADTEAGKAVDLLHGAVTAEVVKQPAGRALVLTTPHAEARVLGTRLRLAVEADGTRLEVREGRVRFTRTRDGSAAEVGAGAFATTSAARVAARAFREASFQDGVAPVRSYAGTRDTFLSETHPAHGYGDSATIQVDGDNPGGSGKDLNLLLRWDLSAMPRGAKVLSAVVTLRESHPARRPFPAYPLLRAWTEEGATWLRASEAGAWQAPGAAGARDRGIVPLGLLSPRDEGVYELRLNAEGLAVVQGWIDAPESNHGLIFPGGDGADGLQAPSREHPDPARRPKLTLTYLPR